jgi:hypothetical protein
MKRITILAMLVAVFSGSCGKKGDLRAPELASPKVITNLSANSGPNGVVLTWSPPTRFVDDRPIKDLTSFIIFRKEVSPGCPDCLVPYRPLATVGVEDREKFVKQRQYRFVDEEAQPNTIYRYRVSSQLSDGSLSEPSNEVEVTRGP